MTFALITEGISEHKIIKHIITKYFKDHADETEINQIQPKVINDKQANTGSWNEVLKYCERAEDLKAIFVENDYLVIQIDTDQCQQLPFNVKHAKAYNSLKSVEELYIDVIKKLKSLINPDIITKHGNKILFAICVHTIECWLLPIYSDNHKAAVTTCLGKLNAALTKKEIHTISLKEKNNPASAKTYGEILKNWKRKQDIIGSSQHNPAFKNFIESMEAIKPVV